MKLREFIEEENNQELNEGIKFFKDSVKIKKLINKVNKQIDKIENEKERAKLKAYIKKLNRVFKELDKLEKDYKNATSNEEKEALKKEYRMKIVRYNNIIKEASLLENTLKKVGLFLIIGGILAIIFVNYINPEGSEITTGNVSGDRTNILKSLSNNKSSSPLESSDIKGDYFKTQNGAKTQLDNITKGMKNTFGNILDNSKNLKTDIFNKIKSFFNSSSEFSNPLIPKKGNTPLVKALSNPNIKG